MTNSEKLLLEFIESKYSNLDAIVVEGYDGVGKGRILDLLATHYGVTPYRPDYNFWNNHDLRNIDRWKISGYFWDVFSHFREGHTNINPPMLFDRGVLSGAVYNNDTSIAYDYKRLLRDRKVLHILVTCTEEDYKKFQIIRNSELAKEEIENLWSQCRYYTWLYKELLKIADVPYFIHYNFYDELDSERLSHTCAGCGHYSYGVCRHPNINSEVDPSQSRCILSTEAETQDRESEFVNTY